MVIYVFLRAEKYKCIKNKSKSIVSLGKSYVVNSLGKYNYYLYRVFIMTHKSVIYFIFSYN